MNFLLKAPFKPCADQAQAISALVKGAKNKKRAQVLLGVTGSGKTFTIAKVIETLNRPALVIAHNKTLAAQLFQEFREFFPQNAVEYFVSYYDYYQPEAYLPTTDTYIEKDAKINEDIDRLRHSATRSLYERRDVIIVASVSCIYGLGSPEAYYEGREIIGEAQRIERDDFLKLLVRLQYNRQDDFLERGSFRVRGDTVYVLPSYEETAYRVEFFGDTIDAISAVDPVSGERLFRAEKIALYPKTHYFVKPDEVEFALKSIKNELAEESAKLRAADKPLEAERLEQRTLYDLEMIREVGYCRGIENYSRHFDGRSSGEPPNTLLDYFPDDFLVVIDESHQTIPQLRGMYEGDRSRKGTLVEYGFRLPSALDNRPLKFEEFEEKISQRIFVSATPGPYELSVGGKPVEQIVRPTGLMDPEIDVRKSHHQVDDLLGEIQERVKAGERILVTTLTKKMAEDLCRYYQNLGVKVKYLHSDIDTLERVEILRDLRRGVFCVLIGVNLLREGLDLPEVSLVAIMDADKEGFLRSETALIQTAGRAARNIHSRVIMYADTITKSMQSAIKETQRRRKIQAEYNRKHSIIPRSIEKPISEVLGSISVTDYYKLPPPIAKEKGKSFKTTDEVEREIKNLEKRMRECAKRLEFEKAARLRDKIKELKAAEIFA